MLRAFDRPKESIRWAREAVDEFQSGFRQFFEEQTRPPVLHPCYPYVRIIDLEPETFDQIHKLRFCYALPRALERKANEALQNIRNSFDQSLFAACTAIHKVPRRGDLRFPWCTTPNDLAARLNKRQIIPAEFHEIIRREEPYPTGDGYTGGNDTIRQIAHLANDKHTVGLKVLTHAAVARPPSIMSLDPWVVVPEPSWNMVKNEIFLCKVSPRSKVHDNYQLSLQVAFDVSAPVGDMAADTLLGEFADRAKRFAEVIEARCTRLIQ
ncbi:hypothetical protein [uncultured Jannaschia sp.]|uniref:hypothetical protein n=1 Tax=uncultured Jannaschia sp. TaxID=293347 RepID=UPI00262803B4|nr:hypothetical protein [uncultured Jannaschia sp.]